MSSKYSSLGLYGFALAGRLSSQMLTCSIAACATDRIGGIDERAAAITSTLQCGLILMVLPGGVKRRLAVTPIDRESVLQSNC